MVESCTGRIAKESRLVWLLGRVDSSSDTVFLPATMLALVVQLVAVPEVMVVAIAALLVAE